MIATENFEQVEVTSSTALRAWLQTYHSQNESVWLVTFKKSVPDKYLSTHDVLDQLLCFGWIDGLRRKLDEDRTMQLIGPRRHQAWAQTYKDRAARLIEDGVMQASGFAAIEASKAQGLWDATADVDALLIPDDLAAALDRQTDARRYFDNAAPSYRRNVLRWIFGAKTDTTRQKRIALTVETSARGERIPQL
jgi:uncharacterized protein YdeI (YjbR/CyaY-like superfamily)